MPHAQNLQTQVLALVNAVQKLSQCAHNAPAFEGFNAAQPFDTLCMATGLRRLIKNHWRRRQCRQRLMTLHSTDGHEFAAVCHEFASNAVLGLHFFFDPNAGAEIAVFF